MTERELRRTALIIPPRGRAVLCCWAAIPGLLAAPFVFWQSLPAGMVFCLLWAALVAVVYQRACSYAAALGADLVKIGLGLPHGVNGVSGVGRKDAAGIIHRRGVSEKKIDQRDLVSARTQRACRARAGADGNIALGAQSAADNSYVQESCLPCLQFSSLYITCGRMETQYLLFGLQKVCSAKTVRRSCDFPEKGDCYFPDALV